jgi:hypothetical protein
MREWKNTAGAAADRPGHAPQSTTHLDLIRDVGVQSR